MDMLRTVAAIAVVLVVVVVVHEMGHYLVAKWSGIQVDEFAVGFGPKLFWRKVGGTVYALRVLPFGGFVRLAGMTGMAEEQGSAAPGAFWRASIPRRTATILAGGVFNLIFAGIVFSALAIPGQASDVPSYGPLAKAGMRSGDTIVAVNGHSIDSSSPETVTSGLHAATDASDGQPLSVTYTMPDGGRRTITVKPLLLLNNLDRSNGLPDALVVDTVNGKAVGIGDPFAVLGSGSSVKISGHVPDNSTKEYTGVVSGVTTGAGGVIGHVQAAWRLGFTPGYDGSSLPYAVARGFSAVPRTVADTFSGLYDILTTPNSGGLRGNVQGPVGVVKATGDAAQAGWMDFLYWIGFLSLNLGIFNLLPIPFLDGGRFVFIALEAVRHRRVDPRREAAIHYLGLMLILALVFYVTFTGDIGGRS